MSFFEGAKKLAGDAYNAAKNAGNKIVMDVSKTIYPPPETPQFQENGKLSPQQFIEAGDKLTQVCSGWKWMPSSNPKYLSKYLNEKKQYLILQNAHCKRRLKDFLQSGQEEKITEADGQEIIVLNSTSPKQEEEKKQDYRCYKMYIIYDEHYHTPRMYFSATDFQGKPVSNKDIEQDIQKQYLGATLTHQNFPFIQNTVMPTVHPCKHANVLKSMSDAMRENGQKVDAHFALFIFLKFITSVIPNVEFDLTGQLGF